MNNEQSRRAFLKRSAALSVAGGATPFVMNLAAIGEAAASTASDYKALVCIFMFGGNDNANTVTPYDQASYNEYRRLRVALAHNRDALTPTLLSPTIALPGGLQYALAPSMSSLMPVFDAGKLAVMLNVGTLVQPVTKAQVQSGSARLPPKLFSHNDQQSYFQASSPEGAVSGWGGRMGDLFQSGNGSAALTCINAAGSAVYLTGRSAVQYAVTSNGPIALNANNSLFGSTTGSATLKSIMSGARPGVFENEHARVARRSLELTAQVSTALAAGPTLTSSFPAGNPLADQLRIVARMIAVSSELGAKRQVFFVSTGGFDNHDNLVGDHPPLLTRVSTAMRAFYDTTVALGVADRVTVAGKTQRQRTGGKE